MSNGLNELLQKMSTEQLDEMLQAELKKRPLDAGAVKIIMELLEDRERPVEMTPEIETVWKEFQMGQPIKRTVAVHGMLLRVASVILVLGILFWIVPQEAGAKSLWDRFIHVTDSIFEFFNPSGANDHRVEYEFKTDHPGLQQVYDAVVEMGVTEPVVPMWLPEGYELVEIKKETTRVKTEVYARFSCLENGIVYKVDLCEEMIAREYYKDESATEKYEKHGVIHNVLRNHDKWVAIWARDNVECFLTIECQEELLYEILESIYVMGDD